MSKTKSNWTDENMSRYVDLIRIEKMSPEKAHKIVEQSIQFKEKLNK